MFNLFYSLSTEQGNNFVMFHGLIKHPFYTKQITTFQRFPLITRSCGPSKAAVCQVSEIKFY